jgi:hypothetical protein
VLALDDGVPHLGLSREEMDEMVRNLRHADEETRRQLAEGNVLRDREFLAEMSAG